MGKEDSSYHVEGFKRLQPNDVVTVIADLNQGELGIRVNNISHGIII